MDKSMSPLPSDGCLLHGPLQLADAEINCWCCKKPMRAVALIAASVEVFEDGESIDATDQAAFVYAIGEDDMPAELVNLLAVMAPEYRPIYSRTMAETTWANACPHCGSLQGASFLHDEPDGPFFGCPDEYTGNRVELLPHSVTVPNASYSH